MSQILTSLTVYATYLGIIGLTLFLAWATYQSNLLLKTYRPNFNLLLAPPELISRLGLVGICLLLIWLSGLSNQQLGLTSPNLKYSLTLGLGLGLVTQLGLNQITRWLLSRFGNDIYSPIVIQSILPQSRRQWPLVALALVPAVAMEELLFRTLWLGVFTPIVPLPWLIIGTSIIFGLMHLPQGKLGIILTGSINVLFCLLFIWTNEFLIVFVIHYTINLLQLIVAYFQKNQDMFITD